MVKSFGEKIVFIFIPLITLTFCSFQAIYVHNSYSIDPDYAYLFNGLNVIRGECYSIVHVDHPGTPLQVLTGLFIFIISIIRGADDMTRDILTNPEIYIKTIIISISFFHSVLLFFIGKRYFRYQRNLLQALLLQFSYLLIASIAITSSKLFTETIIPLGSFLIILLTIEKTWGKLNEMKFALLSGIVLGIFVATKITFLPVAMIPIMVAVKWKNKMVIILSAIILFLISILPVIDRIILFQSFIHRIATHSGTYGSGTEELLNISKLLGNLWKILQADYTFTLILILSLAILVFALIKQGRHFLNDPETRVLTAIVLIFLVQLIIVSRHFGFRYMAPSLLFSGFALVLIIRYLQKFRILYLLSLIIVLIFSAFYLFKMLNKAVSLRQDQELTYSFIKENIKSTDPVIIVSRDSWFGSPFTEHSVMFGKQYCLHDGEQYGNMLRSLSPNRYFFDQSNKQYINWDVPLMPEWILSEHQYCYLYIQTDNPGLYQNVRLDFTERLKNQHSGGIIKELVFSNPAMDEEIYLIRANGHYSVAPTLLVTSDFEEISANEQFVLSSHDSISFQETGRLTKEKAFQGNYSVNLKPENPYGISATIPFVNQFGWIHISIMCQRKSIRHECCIGIKSFDEKEGFVNLGGVSTSMIDGWEKIEYTYRFDFQPAGGKVVFFIWNNSNEPMYFDNIKIELY